MRGHVRGYWEPSPEDVLNRRDIELADDGHPEVMVRYPTPEEMERAFTQYQQEHPE